MSSSDYNIVYRASAPNNCEARVYKVEDKYHVVCWDLDADANIFNYADIFNGFPAARMKADILAKPIVRAVK